MCLSKQPYTVFVLFLQYVPPPLEELIDANICYAANSSLFQDSMCAQAAQQIANDIPTGQSITTAAAAYACNDTCRNLIMSQINSCVRGVSSSTALNKLHTIVIYFMHWFSMLIMLVISNH